MPNTEVLSWSLWVLISKPKAEETKQVWVQGPQILKKIEFIPTMKKQDLYISKSKYLAAHEN